MADAKVKVGDVLTYDVKGGKKSKIKVTKVDGQTFKYRYLEIEGEKQTSDLEFGGLVAGVGDYYHKS